MEEKSFKHKIKISVRFSDLDALRHVNNAAYLSYLEEARIAYFNDVLDLPRNSLNIGAIIARIEIDYLRPIVLGDEVEILTRVSKIGNKSIDVEHLLILVREGESSHAAAAVTKLVSYDYKKLQSMAISDEIKDKIRTFEGISVN
jgi:acyl-CoA thioester hydrolase